MDYWNHLNEEGRESFKEKLYNLIDNDDKIDEMEEKKDKENDGDENEDTNNNKNKVNISNEIKKNVILKIFKQCFGEKSNYPLFKYIANPFTSL